MNKEEQVIEIDKMTAINTQKPKSYLAWSLVNTSLCIFSCFSLLFSVRALDYSFRTQHDLNCSNFDKARLHSKLAFKFNLIANLFCLCGLFILVLLFIFSDKILNYFIFKVIHD